MTALCLGVSINQSETQETLDRQAIIQISSLLPLFSMNNSFNKLKHPFKLPTDINILQDNDVSVVLLHDSGSWLSLTGLHDQTQTHHNR
jgi:hypothetical protein